MSKERILLLILAAALFTHIMDFMIVMPLGSQLMRLFDISARQFSFLVSSYTYSAGLAGFVAAMFIDRFDRKSGLLLVYSGFTLGTLACAVAPTYEILLFTRSLTGMFGGIIGALVLSIVSDVIPLERRAAGIGFVMAAFSIASVFGVPFGLYLASVFSWHAPFLLLGGIGIVVTIMIVIFIPKMTNHLDSEKLPQEPFKILASIFSNKNAVMGLIFTSVLMFGHFTIIPFIATYMVGNVGFSEQDLTYIYLVGGGLTIFTSPQVGKLADKYGRLNIYTIFAILVMIPILVITHLPPIPLWQALVVSGVFFVFANGRIVPSTTMVTSVVSAKNRASFMSIRSSIQQISSGTAAMIAGFIVSEKPSAFGKDKDGNDIMALVNYEYVGYFAIVFSIIALFVARYVKVAKGA